MRRYSRVWMVVFVLAAVAGLGGCSALFGWLLAPIEGGTVSWDTDAEDWRDQTGRQVTVVLPADGTEYSIWGTDIYTDDSPIGTAAVHAGLITFADGGEVTIKILPGQSSYEGSTRNGVTSDDYGAWDASYEFVTD